MKEFKDYYGQMVKAYQDHDLEPLTATFQTARDMWYWHWVQQGREDVGTCTGGKGIEVRYLAPRKRNYEWKRVVAPPPVQGNVSAFRSVTKVIEFLERNDIEATYNDGWMD
jgi:hypothetical protein